ncbi:MAG: preprotein translocase subunit SecA [Sphingobacteriales bacterium]|jgi:preprotein translocase subunit SecA|nr:preprotein translocase subunit SecA [Sphingobacteriales bacterium]MBP9142478.1 preprotein translocase subunit SecA [Chitinophagales bacterium]MDA0199395.1 preprotein translocase subunit SecA [Bacteroidota bacterium]MBK7527334.1 preprotein translocase subunit SecA [Sphingobacteriales bacterium]MBK8678318.1 preprotein translocase subunit SecA [Sphingobacteriales bacterium]
MANFVLRVLEGLFGKKSDKDIKAIMPLVNKINEIYPNLASISNDALRARTQEFRERIAAYLADVDNDIEVLQERANSLPNTDIAAKETLYAQIDKRRKDRDQQLEVILLDLLPEAFATVRETARRFKENETLRATATPLDRELAAKLPHIVIEGDEVIYSNSWLAAGNTIKWDMVHYDVQLIGGIVLHQGKIAEMATGEGKTLVSTLPAYLNALAGQGVHLVTVNDYLAKRDCEWNSGLFNFLDITVDCIDRYQPHTPQRRQAYLADITYGTNNEFGFDYLRDNMTRHPEELVQRKHHFAMVDEVDSVLVDDARTPLIISGPTGKTGEEEYLSLKPRIEHIVKKQQDLVRDLLNQARKQIEAGQADDRTGGLALLRAQRGLPKYTPLIKFLSEPGIKQILLRTESAHLEQQSRRMPEADAELYFVIEEKNNSVHLTDKGIALITGDGEDNNFFVLPDIGASLASIDKLSITAEEKAQQKETLIQDYSVKAERLHAVTQLLKAYTLFEKEVEYVIIDGKIKIVDEQTGRIMEGRRYSDGLHQALEAKENVTVEATTQTFATITLQNYFRMFHKLAGMTGTAETEAGEFWEIYKLDVIVIPSNKPIIRKDEQDLIYRTRREKYNAVVTEISKLVEKGRPVLVGTTSVENSEVLSRYLKQRNIEHNVLNAKQHAREADIVAEAGLPGKVTIATNMAGRGTDIKLGPGVREAGGLAIIGTERHDARRIDRQLRGRAGRQGDTGSSQFYVSLEDDLMRKFGSERIAGIMDKFGYKEGEVIQHSIITSSIERAQKKVEENNFGIRKRLLDYDEVMNIQRKAIYNKRHHALFGERLSVDLANTFRDLSDELVLNFKPGNDFESFQLEVMRCFSIEPPMNKTEFATWNEAQVADTLYKAAAQHYTEKVNHIKQQALPVIQRIRAQHGDQYLRISVPMTDGRRGMNIVIDIQEALDTNCANLVTELEKNVVLSFIDDAWKEHLREMDDLRNEVQNAVYEQKDPLIIFKKEAFNLFRDMMTGVNSSITTFLFRAHILQQSTEEAEAQQRRRAEMERQQRQRELAERQQTQTNRTNDDNGENEGADVDNNEAANPNKRTTGPRLLSKEDYQERLRSAQPKVGANQPCPCGSGKKYKNCHGK